ncbi:MAG: VOC family protein [Actinobacteria bacterium]|nr:VOC family protein [Actinomycetota bacterium]
MNLDGIHHITAITGDAPRNVDFYTRVLGLRMTAKTVNQDDPSVYHLFYGDENAQPGADLTFFEYPGAIPGRPGGGMVHRIVWRVGSEASLGFWERRLVDAGVRAERTGGALRFADPEGLAHELVVSTAIGGVNPERAVARDRGLREIHRGALLGELSRLRRTIAIAGTHGKTTTASMAAHALLALGWDPMYAIGGELRRPPEPGPRAAAPTRTNAAVGTGEWLVVEADESDRSFLELAPEIAVVTNIELDHHTTYASHAELELAFGKFLRQGLRCIVADTPQAEAFLDRVGVEEAAFFAASEIELRPDGSRFVWAGQPVALSVPGAHNVSNAAAALTACVIAGARPREVAGTLADFAGAGRRFERLGPAVRSGALVVDDYAHHPTELRATIAAARTLAPARVVACFQPHLYSRTKQLQREFGRALALADAVVVVDIYPAREDAADYPGVTGYLVARAAAEAARGRPVYWLPRMDDAAEALRALLGEGDVLITLGAGDVDRLAAALVSTP